MCEVNACVSRVRGSQHVHSGSSNDCESISPAVVEIISLFSLFLAEVYLTLLLC